jgi:hypothetical protein
MSLPAAPPGLTLAFVRERVHGRTAKVFECLTVRALVGCERPSASHQGQHVSELGTVQSITREMRGVTRRIVHFSECLAWHQESSMALKTLASSGRSFQDSPYPEKRLQTRADSAAR